MKSGNDAFIPEIRYEPDCEDADGRFIIRDRWYCGNCGTAINERDTCCDWCEKQINWDGGNL